MDIDLIPTGQNFKPRVQLILKSLFIPGDRLRLLLWPLAVCLLYIAAKCGTLILQSYTPMPIWDYWRAFQDYFDASHGNWSFLWRQYNDHRLFFPELVFVADMFFWHGRKLLPLLLTFLCYLQTWVFLSLVVVRDKRVGQTAALYAAGVAGCLIFWPTVALPLAEAFLLQWTMMQVAVAASLLFLSRVSAGQGQLSYLAVLMTGVIATYSSGNGMLVWPVLWALAFIVRLGARHIAGLLLTGALAIGCYFIHYTSAGSVSIGNITAHWTNLLGFVISYLGMPFAFVDPSAREGLIAGTIVLLLYVICLFTVSRLHWLKEPAAIVLLGFMTFNLLTAFMTAVGRMSPADVTFASAKQVRYLTVPQMNWGAALLALLWIAARINIRRVFIPTICVLSLGLALYLPKLQPWLIANSEALSEYQLAALSFEDRVPDWGLAIDRVLNDLAGLKAGVGLLEQSHKGIYYRGRDRWLHQPAARFAPLGPSIAGAVVATFPTGPGIQVTGWLDDSALRKHVLWVVLTDENGLIQGFGRRFPCGFPIPASDPAVPPSLGWVAYVPADLAGKRVIAYALDPEAFLLEQLAVSLRIPPVTAPDPSHFGDELPAISWTSKLTTSLNSLPSGLVTPGDTPRGSVQATYGGSDANTGSLTSSAFPRPPDGCLIVPVLPGPSAAGLNAYIADAANGGLVQALPLRSARNHWHFWRVQVSADHPVIQIVLEDRGRDWGQWIAASTPLSCR